MPGMTGLEVQAELLNRDVSIPIIFISGDSRYNEVVDAVRDGAFYFLQKPFSRSELLSQVREAIAESRRRQEKSILSAHYDDLLDKLTGR